ncbi:hypothetical protein P5V15_001738 [Pogonomyrmex californicus]
MQVSQSCVTVKETLIDDINLVKDVDINDKKSKMIKSKMLNFKTDIIWYIALQLFVLKCFLCNYWKHTDISLKLYFSRAIFFPSFHINTIYKWVQNHCLHHKYCATDADSHNNQCGFFYAHYSWVMIKEHPEFIKKTIRFIRYYDRSCCKLSYRKYDFIRYMITLNFIWTINSVAQTLKNINPADNNFVTYITARESYHNFHHVFPWDYRSSESGNNRLNYTTFFIDICAKLGLAYDLKYPSDDHIKNVILKRGDGTYFILSKVPKPQ